MGYILFKEKIHVRFLIFSLLSLIILNPYTILGPLGYFLLPLMVLPCFDKIKLLGTDTLFLLFFIVFLSLIGVFSSFLHGIGQFVHFKVSVSIFAYVFMAYAIFLIAKRNSIDFDSLVYFCLLAVVLNSAIILAQVSLPHFRGFIEKFLVLSGNVDWTEGVRFRGLASGGGASLSVLIPVAIVLALHLYSEGKIGLLNLIFFSSVLLLSLFFIGRTGFLLLPFVLFLFLFFYLYKYFFKVFILFVFLTLLVLGLGDDVRYFVVGKFGSSFYDYSFGFILDGFDGFKDEGTFNVIMDFLKVMPTKFPEFLIGYGFYGGSDFSPWTDSGYSRMFLSIGYLFGVIFYLSFFCIFRNVIFREKFVFITIGLILLIAEAKEPLLFSGYASQVYIIILVFKMLEIKSDKIQDGLRKSKSFDNNDFSKAI